MPLEVILTPEQEAFIAAQVATGRYPHASAVVGEALSQMQAAEAIATARSMLATAVPVAQTRIASERLTLMDLFRALQKGVELDRMAVRLVETEFVGRLPALLECCCKTDRVTPSPQLVAYCARIRDRFGG